jgi:hypothetical protein
VQVYYTPEGLGHFRTNRLCLPGQHLRWSGLHIGGLWLHDLRGMRALHADCLANHDQGGLWRGHSVRGSFPQVWVCDYLPAGNMIDRNGNLQLPY